MITNFKLFEGKQVGILYHWTDIESLYNIIRTNKMISTRYYNSFSRNKNLNFESKQCKIIFDGNKMSDKFKIEPYLYHSDYSFKVESEERIKCKEIGGINKFIIGIEIKRDVYSDPYDYYLNFLRKKLPNVEIKII